MRSISTLFFIFFIVLAANAAEMIPTEGMKSFYGDSALQKSDKVFKSQSILATGKWIRMSTDKTGILKLTYSKLSELGIANPANVAVFTNGGFMLPKINSVDYPDDLTQIPIIHGKDKNGANCVFFYSPGTTKWNFDNASERFIHEINLYTDSTFFYLSSDVAASVGPSINETTPETSGLVITTYVARSFYEVEDINIYQSGRKWFSDVLMDNLRKSYTNFNFPNAISSKNATITVGSASRCTSKAPSMTVKINNTSSYIIQYYKSSNDENTILNGSYWSIPAKENFTLDFTFSGTEGSAWIDFISLNVPSKLTFTGSQLDFRTYEALNQDWVKFTISETNPNCLVWNVTDPLNPKQITTSFISNSKETSFNAKGRVIDEFVVFDPGNGTFSEPRASIAIKNQNLHGQPSSEMIIVTHPDFINESNTLAEFHRQYDKMSVLVVTTDEVYNEFSSGLPDISAIRNMFRMFYLKGKNSSTLFKYALLVGDGSYNNRSFDRVKFNNYIPTYQSVNSWEKGASYTTDDFYGWFSNDKGDSADSLYIGIGRFPCKTASEAEMLVNKVIDYNKPKTLGNWRNVICFLADDQGQDQSNWDGDQFMSDSETLNDLINTNYPGFFSKKIYFDSYQQITTSGGFGYPDATDAINESVNEGALILNYIGHGNPISLAHENVLIINNINSWKNSTALPLFVTATCEFGRFDGDSRSAAEDILLNPSGGGIALFTTTRTVNSGANFELSKNFYSNIFKHDKTGEKLRLGDVMKNAKNSTYGDNKLSFALLADPALRLAFPKYSVRTSTINDIIVDSTTNITLGALEKVTIKGEVINPSTKEVLTNYSGVVSTTIYDKVDTVETLANDGGDPYRFPVQDNIIYKGESSVVNGQFELSFIIPKDISYNIGKGKIIYYTSNGENDGNGAVSTFNIGGSSKNPVIDNNPPEINMVMNTEDFKPYGIVSSSALLLVDLFDESGINTVGTGIGHDLIAVLDDDYSNPIVLNSFYSSVANSYQKGRISYLLSGMEPGEHKMWIRVWDVQNNSSEKEIYFIVEEKFKLTSVTNFPNPVSSSTDFVIDHNLPGDIFDVTIDIYNLSGQKVNTISESVSSAKTATITINWNVFQSDYPVFSDQWLVYRIKLKNQDGLSATGAGKLLITSKN